MTPLRQKLIDEIQLRGFSINTQDSYVRSVAGLAQFYHRSPDKIADDEIKAYLLHLLRVKKLAVNALRFFFGAGKRTGEPRQGRFVWTDTWVRRNGPMANRSGRRLGCT